MTFNAALTIARMQQEAWQNSEDHGFHETPDVGLPTRLMLIVSELADVIIRVGDLAGVYGIDLETAVVRKMNYNRTRPHKHGKAY